MADEIIDFYKKAKEPEEPQKPIEEQKETPVPEIPKPDEPFDRFLLELAEKLQKEKVITEKQQETFVEQIKEPVSTDPNENDPFKKFIGSFANILKEDELVNREENIKEATINFINKLKEQPEEPFIIEDEPIIKSKQKKYLPPKIAKKVQKLPQFVKKEEPIVAEQADEPVKEENTYVKELKTSDKTNKKLPEKVKSVSDIKSIVEKQVAEILSRYPNLGFTGGGGGTNAVQYALGGSMDGDLNVTGSVNASTFLSGGTNLLNILSSSGGGEADRLISGSESLILNSDGSVSFPNNFIVPPDGEILNIESETDTIDLSGFTRISLSPYAFFAYNNEGDSITFAADDNAIVLTSQDEHEWTFNQQGVLVGPHGVLTVNALSSLGQILSGGKDLSEIFLTSETDSQTLYFTESSAELSISNGNTVLLSSLKEGGTNIQTVLDYLSTSNVLFSGITITDNLSVNGTFYTNASALVLASFTQTIGNNTNTTFNISHNFNTKDIVISVYDANTSTQSYPEINLTDNNNAQIIFDNPPSLNQYKVVIFGSVPSNQINAYGEIYTTFITATGFGDIPSLSGTWNQAYTIVSQNSSIWSAFSEISGDYATYDYTDNTFLNLTGGSLSGSLEVSGDLNVTGQFLSGGISLFNILSTENTGRDDVNTIVIETSATWNDVSTVVQQNSANWSDITIFNTPVTDSYTLQASDRSNLVTVNNSLDTNIIVPDDATYNFDSGVEVNITRLGSGNVTILGGTGVDIRSADNRNKLRVQYSTATVLKLSADTWLMFGDLTT